MRIFFAVLRAGVAVAIVAAVIGQLMVSIDFWTRRGDADIPLDVVNFLSFFTIQSNVFAAVVLVIGAGLLLGRRSVDPPWFAVAITCAATYMITTGIVYNLLLRGIELPQGATLAWSNEVLHAVAPAYLLIDRLAAPATRALSNRVVAIAVIYPVVWAVYTLARGPFTPDQASGASSWYPYPFVNPDLSEGGYLSVSLYIVVIAIVIAAITFVMLWLSRRRGSGLTRTSASS